MTQLFSRLALDWGDRNLCSVFLKPNVEKKKAELNLLNKLGKHLEITQPLKVLGFRLGTELGKKKRISFDKVLFQKSTYLTLESAPCFY